MTILHDVTLTVSPGDRVAVVGPNGVGKTTLLRILAGEITPDTGAVVRRPRSASVVHVPQESTVVAGETLSEHLARRTGVAEREAAMNAAAEALAAGRRGAGDAYSDALESWLTAGGADFAERASAVCARLGLEVDVLARGAGALSGGQAARVRLAVVGLTRADVLLLDEPTNDLDLDGLAQLEEIVVNTPSGVVLVSHDREFLALTVTRVLEIDEFSRQSTVYSGGWRAYLDERGLAAARAQQAYDEYADKRDELTERARRQREWAREGARRSSNPAAEQDKHIRYRETQRAQKTGAKAVITESALQRLEAVEEPRTPWELRLSIASAGRGSEVVFALRGAVAARGDVRLGPIDLSVNAGERIRLIGPNGSGKTTLLDAMLGRLPLLAGESYVGPGVVIGELDQTRRDLRGAGSLLDVFQSLSELSPVEARTLLAKFRIGADVVLRGADTLSPGERTRAGLALFQARGVTCLVLDEPTNHLDLPAIEQLEQALSSYDGTLLLVTHDRRLAEAVEITREIDVVSLASGVPSD